MKLLPIFGNVQLNMLSPASAKSAVPEFLWLKYPLGCFPFEFWIE